MVAVVVHQHDVATVERNLTVALQPAADALETGQPGTDRLRHDAEFPCNGDGGQGVVHVVPARQIQGDVIDPIALGQLDVEPGARAVGAQAVAVCTGRYGRDDLSQHDPDLLFDSLGDPSAFVQQAL